MAEIDAQAMFHRTLGRPARTDSDHLKSPYGTAYTYHSKRELAVTSYIKTDEQRDFRKYATSWELQHSREVAGGNGTCVPVVDAQKMVVGHVGSFDARGEVQIYVPANLPEEMEAEGLVKLVGRGVPVLAHHYLRIIISHPVPKIYNPAIEVQKNVGHEIRQRLGVRPLGVGLGSWDLVTDTEGHVVAIKGGRSVDNSITPHWMTPIDLVVVPKLVGGLIIKTLFRKSFRDATVRGAAEELGTQIASRVAARRTGKVTAEEMERLLTEVLAQRPELRRLMAARLMTGEGRMQAIKVAWQEWERAHGWKVVEKTAKEMQAVTHPQNLMTLRTQTRELWINKDRAARWDPAELYKETAHEFSAHALTGRGGTFTGADLAFIGHEFSKTNNALFILENAIMHEGGLQRVLQTYR